MTRCAPRGRIRPTFLALHTPVTSAPRTRAICTANVPTPPDAPLMSTFCPGCSCPLSRRPCRAVRAATGAEAGSENLVAWIEPGDVLPHPFHLAGNVHAQPVVFGPPQP